MPLDSPPASISGPEILRVKLTDDDLTYDTIKSAIYAQARDLHARGDHIGKLLLSKDLFEILNRRLVFKTAAHKDLPHFITPYGNLEAEAMDVGMDEPMSFIIQ